MSRPYSTAAFKQLHATLPGPSGMQACLTLYDECPHASYSTASLGSRDPCLHCDLPCMPSNSNPRAQTLSSIERRVRDVYDSTCNTLADIQPRKEKAMAAYLAPLVMSKHSPMMHHIRESTADALRAKTASAAALRSILKPNMPTIYLVSFSTERTRTTRDFARLLNRHLPSGASLRYTIDARRFLVPSRQIQELYSGVAEVTQDAVLQDRGARREVEHAVGELMDFVVGNEKGRETAIAVCCTAGTHRSVAIAECIAKGVRREVRRMGEGAQVKVVVRHVHRVRGAEDPY